MWSSQDISEPKKLLIKPSKKSGYWIVAVTVILCFAAGKNLLVAFQLCTTLKSTFLKIGILIGRYGTTVDFPHTFDVKNLVIDEISAEHINSNLRYFLITKFIDSRINIIRFPTDT